MAVLDREMATPFQVEWTKDEHAEFGRQRLFGTLDEAEVFSKQMQADGWPVWVKVIGEVESGSRPGEIDWIYIWWSDGAWDDSLPSEGTGWRSMPNEYEFVRYHPLNLAD